MNIVFVGNVSCGFTKDWSSFLKDSFQENSYLLFDTAEDIIKCNSIKNPIFRNGLKFYTYFKMLFNFLVFLKKNRIDVIHFNGAYFFLLNFIYLFFNGKIITSPQGSEINEQCYGYQKFFVKSLLKHSHTITARSAFMKYIIEERLECRDSRIEFVTFGISDKFFATTNCVGIDDVPKPFSIRATGQIYNIDKIFQAVKELKQEGHKFLFSYVEFSKESGIELDLSICDAVYRSLKVDEVIQAMSLNDCIISVPSFDGFSVSVMEALAIGTLPVISDIESYNGEFLDSKIVVKTKIDDYLDLKNTLLNVVNNIQAIRQNVNLRKEYAKEHYSRDAQKKIIEKIYLSLQAN